MGIKVQFVLCYNGIGEKWMQKCICFFSWFFGEIVFFTTTIRTSLNDGGRIYSAIIVKEIVVKSKKI